MSKLKKYTSFEALKSEAKPASPTENTTKALSEYEAFLHLLQRAFATKQQAKATHGK